MGADTGAHSLSFLPPSLLWSQTCPQEFQSYSIQVDSLEQEIEENDFGTSTIYDCTYLHLDIGSPQLRICQQSEFTIEYCNGGTIAAADSYVELILPEHIDFVGSESSFQELGDTVYFELGTIPIAGCGEIDLQLFVDCDLQLGAAPCIRAEIFPHEPCNEDIVVWEGPDLLVEAECENDTVRFTITNLGGDMNTTTDYRMYQNDILVVWEDIILLEGQSFEFEQFADGSTFRLVVEQVEGHPSNFDPQVVVEGCGDYPIHSVGYVTTQLIPDEDPFVEVSCVEIYNQPYNPGDFEEQDPPAGVAVYPSGALEEHFVPVDTELEFEIWFVIPGNVGFVADTVEILVVDSLNIRLLNENRIRPGISSHPYEMSMRNGVVAMTFKDVILPSDSSYGYVHFDIPMREDATGLLTNKAEVYYDYGKPHPTNTTSLTISNAYFNDTATVAISSVGLRTMREDIRAYPVPSDQQFRLSSYSQKVICGSIELYDIYGNLSMQKDLDHHNQFISTTQLPSGVYFYKLLAEGGEHFIGKIMVEH